MKFGRRYHEHQIAEWADEYMNYAAFKRICKRPIEEFNYPKLVAQCMSSINAVDQFYCRTYAALVLKLAVGARYCHPYHYADLDITQNFYLGAIHHSQLQPHKADLVRLAADFDKLRWYGRLNTDGFQKIIGKIGVLGTHCDHIVIQLEEILYGREFATQDQCLCILKHLNSAIASMALSQHEASKKPSSIQHAFCTRILDIDRSISVLQIFHAIERDDSIELEALVNTTCRADIEFSYIEFICVLFEYSVHYFSTSCIDVLISHAIVLNAVMAIEICLRSIIVKLGQGPRGNITSPQRCILLLGEMLESLLVKKLNLLFNKDHLGRIPLHYASENGLTDVCRIILKSWKDWEECGMEASRSAILLEDIQSRSSLELSIIQGHLEVASILIDFYYHNPDSRRPAFSPGFSAIFNKLLLFTVRSSSVEALILLLDMNFNISCCNALGQTPLYLAVRSGNEDIVKLLLRYKHLIERPETTNNWTPLIIASIHGFSNIAETLLGHGANIEHTDLSGWTAVDHASYRGHIELAKYLAEKTGNSPQKEAAEFRYQTKKTRNQLLPRGQPSRTVSSAESYIVVNIGSLDSSNTSPAVFLNPNLMNCPSFIQPDSFFSLGVSIVGTTTPSYMTSLPLLEDTTNSPWIFPTTNPGNAKLAFEIFRNEPWITTGRKLIGRGIALLESYRRSLDTKRESLSRDFLVPILSTVTLDYLGSVNFSFIISTPLILRNNPQINTEALWFENGPSKVVGHRGLGQNLLPATRLQIGENSIQSFLSAIDLGAAYIELDVQLTKDHVPVIYHDFLVSETGIDVPMHTLTYEQFMHISDAQSRNQYRSTCGETDAEEGNVTPLRERMRALSLGTNNDVSTRAFMARVKHTFDYSSRNCKGNTRGNFIHDAFITLEQVLTRLPEDIPINLEIKYPMLSEATDDWKMDPFFVEANFFTDTILRCLSQHISTRAVLLSSFSPEICILLALKQSRWPIAFGTDSGNWKPTDVRARNLQEGVRFAERWNLDGLVLASEPFVLAPRLVEYVKEKGLVCATYRALNDEVDGVTIQAKAGVDIIITNNVRLVSETIAALEDI